jgi:hypothetical protein
MRTAPVPSLPDRRLKLIRPDLDYLGRGGFAAKAPAKGGWFFLDFLGFSRPNLDLSMSYTEKHAKSFSRALGPVSSKSPKWKTSILGCERTGRASSQSELTSISDFLQPAGSDIVRRGGSFSIQGAL